ncbi:hypothetical protein GWK47_042841 [Chionoecetes opilio]|uniref:Uncharacterized protein n=1 Tax=Chionoecetes opilio TaxID=41210 RepID=A0A8J4YMJ6_CHIOP|nr:hypothetical protein GWK47_042841 [Chionoecetes opilio]
MRGTKAGTQCYAGRGKSVYWPGIDAEVEQKRRQCAVCDTHAPSSPQKPSAHPPPAVNPFQQVVADLFQLDGHTYIAVADRLSGWLESGAPVRRPPPVHASSRCSDDGSSASASQRSFRAMGNEPHPPRETRGFLDTWRVRLRVSSAHYPQSNGRGRGGSQVSKRVCYAAPLAGTAPRTPTPLHGPSCSTSTPPRRL